MSVTLVAVGVDSSRASRRAFDWAAGLCATVGSGLVVVHAVGLLEHQHHDDLSWLDELAASHPGAEVVVRDGHPALTLLAVGGERGADLLVVGARGTGGAGASLLGSTSTHVAREATVPVVVVPDGA